LVMSAQIGSLVDSAEVLATSAGVYLVVRLNASSTRARYTMLGNGSIRSAIDLSDLTIIVDRLGSIERRGPQGTFRISTPLLLISCDVTFLRKGGERITAPRERGALSCTQFEAISLGENLLYRGTLPKGEPL